MIKDYVCVDIETTGAQSKWSKIIEIGAVKVIDGEVVDTFSELINPGEPIPALITDLTGITNEMTNDCEYIEPILKRFIEFSKGFILLGHNIRFDYTFLRQNAININEEFEYKCMDTLKIARKVHKELPSRALDFLCSYYGILDENHHRAFNDADVTSQLYQIFCDKFGQEYPEVFEPFNIEVKIKKVQPVTAKQIKYLKALCDYHKIDIDYDIEELSRSEASRKIDKILSEKGRILY